MKDLHILIVFFIIMLLITIGYIKKTKEFNVGVLLLSLYTFCAFCAIIYYQSFYYLIQINELELNPLLYWIVLFLIAMVPVFKYDKLKINKIQYSSKTLEFFCIFAFFLSIIPLVEELAHANLLFQGGNDVAETFSDIHDDNTKGNYLSFLGKTCLHILRWIYELVLLSSFFVMKSKKKLAIAGIITSIITINLYSLTMSSRGQLLTTILYCILIYFLLKKNVDATDKRRIKKVGIFVLGGVLSLFVFITILRSTVHVENNSDYTMGIFLVRYVGEAYINISEYLGDLNGSSFGDYCFWPIKKILMLDPPLVDREYVYNVMQNHLGIRLGIFYTFISYFIFDLGFVGALLFFLFVAFLFTRLLYTKDGIIKFSTMYAFLIYAGIIINGTTIYIYPSAVGEKLVAYFLIFIYLRKVSS